MKRVGERIAEALAKRGVETVEDLLYHLPFRYEDRLNPVPISQLRELTARLAGLYAVKGEKTLTRDVNALVGMGLAIKEGHSLRSAIGIMSAFIPAQSR